MNEDAAKSVGPGTQSGESPVDADARLYVASTDDVQAKVKSDWSREYCYDKRPNEEYFHLIVGGEIYLQQGHQKICLDCAFKRGLITRDRISWQK